MHAQARGQHRGLDIESKGGRGPESGAVLLAVAHGTRDAVGVRTVSQVIDALRARRPDLDVRLAWVELVPPDVRTALASVPPSRPVVVVPLLLASGYHDRVDIPAAVADTRPDAVRAPVLGPDPLLAAALADRLGAAGWSSDDAVVLAAAGSSDAAAVASVRHQADLLSAELGAGAGPDGGTADGAGSAGTVPSPGRRAVRVSVGFGSAAEPDVASAVAAARATGAGRVAVVPYLLAPGFFAARLREAGADLVAEPLGAHPAIVELVLRRFEAAAPSS